VSGEERDPAKSFATLDRIARQEATLGKLDEQALNVCLSKQDDTQILASTKEAMSLGLEGTPMLFVNGEKVSGAVPQEQLWAAIDRALIAAGVQPPPPPPPPAPMPAAGAGRPPGPPNSGPPGAQPNSGPPNSGPPGAPQPAPGSAPAGKTN
jgi:hypothetical protein